MGFISFNLEYYKNEIETLENASASEEAIYRAKQLLKALDDLLDEGYTQLNEEMENAYSGVSRLKAYLARNHAEPFPIYRKKLLDNDVEYERKPCELAEAIKDLTANAVNSAGVYCNAFLAELIRFCKWVGYDENTAYVFLLRDTLLPYVYYQSKNVKNIYPWLLGRKTLTALTGNENVDDEIRASIFRALEVEKCSNYKDFCRAVLPDVRATLKRYPVIEKCLTALLGEIEQRRIIVVESGCSGTFPMLLASIDSRVDVRMYTTYPYLLNVYGDKIYTPKYEEIRLFETLYSQDLYFRFCSLQNGRFFVNKCANKEVETRALAEIKTVLTLSQAD